MSVCLSVCLTGDVPLDGVVFSRLYWRQKESPFQAFTKELVELGRTFSGLCVQENQLLESD